MRYVNDVKYTFYETVTDVKEKIRFMKQTLCKRNSQKEQNVLR